MPVVTRGEVHIWHRRDRRRQLLVWAGYFVATLVFVLCWQLISDKTIWMFVTDAPTQAAAIRMTAIDKLLTRRSVVALKLTEPGPDEAQLERIERQARRAERIISDLLETSRGASAEPEAVSVRELIGLAARCAELDEICVGYRRHPEHQDQLDRCPYR